MTRLTRRLAQVEGVHFTAYADDITIWAEARKHRDIEQAVSRLQEALAAFEKELAFTGMQVSVEKSQYIMVKGTPMERAKVGLSMGGRKLKRPE